MRHLAARVARVIRIDEVWLAARRLNEGQFVWPHAGSEPKQHALTQEQLGGLVVGLPWQRIGPNGVIRVV
ncbi:MAG: hypothetical protein DI523_08125 [Paraburkholderia fungorum]|nr:MAG: hypothetical protein DI523_08125 [Paraburkholderia fungorum]